MMASLFDIWIKFVCTAPQSGYFVRRLFKIYISHGQIYSIFIIQQFNYLFSSVVEMNTALVTLMLDIVLWNVHVHRLTSQNSFSRYLVAN